MHEIIYNRKKEKNNNRRLEKLRSANEKTVTFQKEKNIKNKDKI